MSQNKKSPRPELQNVTDMTVKQLASWGKKFGRTKNLAKTSQFWEDLCIDILQLCPRPIHIPKAGWRCQNFNKKTGSRNHPAEPWMAPYKTKHRLGHISKVSKSSVTDTETRVEFFKFGLGRVRVLKKYFGSGRVWYRVFVSNTKSIGFLNLERVFAEYLPYFLYFLISNI